jgi:hypothetical protein
VASGTYFSSKPRQTSPKNWPSIISPVLPGPQSAVVSRIRLGPVRWGYHRHRRRFEAKGSRSHRQTWDRSHHSRDVRFDVVGQKASRKPHSLQPVGACWSWLARYRDARPPRAFVAHVDWQSADLPDGVTIAAQLGSKPRNCPVQSGWKGVTRRPPVLSVVHDPTSALQTRLNIGNGLTVTEMQRYDVAVQPERLNQFRLNDVAASPRPHHRLCQYSEVKVLPK